MICKDWRATSGPSAESAAARNQRPADRCCLGNDHSRWEPTNNNDPASAPLLEVATVQESFAWFHARLTPLYNLHCSIV
jgi:hypothetical protein